MSRTAAHRVDHVIPRVPVRPWGQSYLAESDTDG
jgi:hypothetical protein